MVKVTLKHFWTIDVKSTCNIQRPPLLEDPGFSLKLDREVENHSEETKSHSEGTKCGWENGRNNRIFL
jgi:hypothetical protein